MLSTVSGILAPKNENINKVTALADFVLFVTLLVVSLLGMYECMDVCYTTQCLMGAASLIGFVVLAVKKVTPSPLEYVTIRNKR